MISYRIPAGNCYGIPLQTIKRKTICNGTNTVYSLIMNATELEQYKLELIAEHEAEIAAIDRLIGRERNKPPASLNGTTMTRHRRTVASVVKEAAMQLTGKFTRKHVAARIESLYPTTRISTRSVAVELWKLARDGEIETVKGGRGRTPATYKRK
jgi:hypothetical protein